MDMLSEQDVYLQATELLGVIWCCRITQTFLTYSQELNLVTKALPMGMRRVIQRSLYGWVNLILRFRLQKFIH